MKPNLFFLLLLFAGCGKDPVNPPADPYVKISISDVSMAEGNSGTTVFPFSVTLEKAQSQEVVVNYNTMEMSAKAGEDFEAVSNGVLRFAPGETEKKININVVTDTNREGDDEFQVKLTSTNIGMFAKGSGKGTIVNDDESLNISNEGYDAPTNYTGYQLAWSDEFNGNSLDLSSWSFENGDGCPNICGWGNNELEYYTDRPQNLFFQDGKLVIEARKESYNGKNYTSSKILTRGKKVMKYGRIDVRAKLPRGRGIWPAIWMMPQSSVYGGWPKSGEIDIMEMLGHEPSKVYGTVHYGPGPGSTQISRPYSLSSSSFYDQFHVFSLEWSQDELKWYVDNQLFSTVKKADVGSNTWPFNEEFYLIINLAVGGNWPGNPDANTSFPQWMILDYVRAYKQG